MAMEGRHRTGLFHLLASASAQTVFRELGYWPMNKL